MVWGELMNRAKFANLLLPKKAKRNDSISSFSWATVRILSYGYQNRKDVFNTFS